MKKLLVIFLLFFASVGYAQPAPIDTATRDLANQVMLNIYQDILKVKDKYPELSQFGEKCFFENPRGIYAIVYEPPVTPASKESFAFGLTIDAVKDETFPGKDAFLNFGFPALGIKFSGYQPRLLTGKQFNLLPLINRQGVILSLHEQKILPLRLEVKPVKDSFKVNEPIEFEAVLTNVGAGGISIKKLGWDTMYFLIDNKPWGTPPDTKTRAGERMVLLQGESTRARFQSKGFAQPTEVEIYAIYRILVKGVNPFATTKIKISP